MPTEIVKTPFGEYAITAKGDKAWLHTTYVEGVDQQFLTINGISFRGSIYMKYELYYDGEAMVKGWHRDNAQGGMYLKRVDNNWAGITSNMMTKVYDELIPWACNWLTNNPDFVHNGWIEVYKEKVDSATKTVVDLGEKYSLVKVDLLKAIQQHEDILDGLAVPPEPDDVCKCGHIRQSHSASCQEYPQGSYRRCDCMVFDGATNEIVTKS